MLHADFIIFEIFEDKAYDTHNFFACPEIQDFSYVFNHVQLEVLEMHQCILVVAEDPEAAADIVGDLSIRLTVFK